VLPGDDEDPTSQYFFTENVQTAPLMADAGEISLKLEYAGI